MTSTVLYWNSCSGTSGPVSQIRFYTALLALVDWLSYGVVSGVQEDTDCTDSNPKGVETPRPHIQYSTEGV
jgi:hypothetical protein